MSRGTYRNHLPSLHMTWRQVLNGSFCGWPCTFIALPLKAENVAPNSGTSMICPCPERSRSLSATATATAPQCAPNMDENGRQL